MFKRYLRAFWAALLHVVVLTMAHSLVEHSGEVMKEVAGLVRDEWVVNAVDEALALVDR